MPWLTNLTSLLIFVNYINVKWRVRNSRNLNKLKKEDLKEYVYVDSYCKEGCVDEYINRTYKFIRMEGELSAIFYRDY